MKIRLLQYFFLTSTLAFSSAVVSQERWFKIELSIFSNENSADRLEEQWHAERTELSYPDGLRRLNKLSDLLLADNLLVSSLNTLSSEDSENDSLDDSFKNNKVKFNFKAVKETIKNVIVSL